jgi:hypothetical protein
VLRAILGHLVEALRRPEPAQSLPHGGAPTFPARVAEVLGTVGQSLDGRARLELWLQLDALGAGARDEEACAAIATAVARLRPDTAQAVS